MPPPDPSQSDPSQSDPSLTPNPYQTPEDVGLDHGSAWNPAHGDPADQTGSASTLSWPKTVAMWSAICIVAASPSFVFGLAVTDGNYLPMIAGVVVYIVGYVAGDLVTRPQSWRRQTRMRTTLRATYIARVAATVIFPVGVFLDLYCGFASIAATAWIRGGQPFFSGEGRLDDMDGWFVFVTTLLQGAACHVVMLVFGILTYLILLTVEMIRRR